MKRTSHSTRALCSHCILHIHIHISTSSVTYQYDTNALMINKVLRLEFRIIILIVSFHTVLFMAYINVFIFGNRYAKCAKSNYNQFRIR